MSTEQLLVRLPDDLVRRFKQVVPTRERSAFVRQLLEQALPSTDSDTDPLYMAALAVEQDASLGQEMAEWEAATIDDGATVDNGANVEERRTIDDYTRIDGSPVSDGSLDAPPRRGRRS